jgi:hypothetical protein
MPKKAITLSLRNNLTAELAAVADWADKVDIPRKIIGRYRSSSLMCKMMFLMVAVPKKILER